MGLRQEIENPMVLDSLWNDDAKVMGTDALGNEIYVGDEIYVLDGEPFVVSEISYDAEKILQMLGAERKYA